MLFYDTYFLPFKNFFNFIKVIFNITFYLLLVKDIFFIFFDTNL